MLFRSNDTATTEIYTLSLHDALPIFSSSYAVNTSFDPSGIETGGNLNLVNFDINDAAKMLVERSINFDVEGPAKNSVVVDQKYVNDEDGNRIMKLITKGKNEIPSDNQQGLKMPDLKGMSLRGCIKALSSLGIEYKITGSGKVTAQVPEPGSAINKNQQVSVICALGN